MQKVISNSGIIYFSVKFLLGKIISCKIFKATSSRIRVQLMGESGINDFINDEVWSNDILHED